MMVSNKNFIGEKLKEICEERNLYPNLLSNRSGVPLTTILHIMDGSTKNPGVYTVLRICSALDISISEFLTDMEPEVSMIPVSDCGNKT